MPNRKMLPPNNRDLVRALRTETLCKLADEVLYSPYEVAALVYDRETQKDQYHNFRNSLAKWASSAFVDGRLSLSLKPDNGIIDPETGLHQKRKMKGGYRVILQDGHKYNAWFGHTWKAQLRDDDLDHCYRVRKYLSQKEDEVQRLAIVIHQISTKKQQLYRLSSLLSEQVYNTWEKEYRLTSHSDLMSRSLIKVTPQTYRKHWLLRFPWIKNIAAVAIILLFLGIWFTNKPNHTENRLQEVISAEKIIQPPNYLRVNTTRLVGLQYNIKDSNGIQGHPLRVAMWVAAGYCPHPMPN